MPLHVIVMLMGGGGLGKRRLLITTLLIKNLVKQKTNEKNALDFQVAKSLSVKI